MTCTPGREHSQMASVVDTPPINSCGDVTSHPPEDQDQTPVLIIGGGVVGCLVPLRLGQAGIRSIIIERLPETSTAPRACGYFGAVLHMLDECGMYKLIREEG